MIKDSKGRSRYSSKKLLKIRRPASRSLGEILRTNDQEFIDFIRQCLQFVYSIYKLLINSIIFRWDPLVRLTPEQALAHPWIIRKKCDRTLKTKKDQTLGYSFFSFLSFKFIFNLDDKEEITNINI